MGGRATVALWVVAMIIIIVGVDLLFFRRQPGERLIANIGIVLLFAALYLIFLRRA
jgi:hypothetical protein